MVYIPYYLYKVQEVQVVGNVCEVTEGRALLVITQVSSGLKNPISSSSANVSTLIHVKIASLANVQSCVNIGPIH